MSNVGQAALLVAFPVAASAAGSTIAVLRPPSARIVSGVQHFAAGVVIAALVGEVLPDLKAEGQRGWAVAGFSAGVILMLTLAAYGRRVDQRRTAAATAQFAIPLGLLVAVGIDLLVDGALVGLGASLGTTQGIILTAALTIEVLFLGLSVAAELTDAGLSKRAAALTCCALGLLTAVGALIAAVALGDATPAVLATVLAFGAAALLYLAVEELLVEAHEGPETPLLSAMFFVGFLLIYALAQTAA